MLKKIAIIVLALALCASAALGEVWKDEVIYASLSHTGDPLGVYVVNAIESDEPVETVDSGAYDEVSSLTYGLEAALENGGVALILPEGRSYYQGNLETRLPWSVAVKYELDGSEVGADKLFGATGDIAIEIAVSRAPDAPGDWYEKFALQTAMTLPAQACFNIVAEGATIAYAGSDYTVNWVSLPGEEGVKRVEFAARDFHMDAVKLVGVRMAMDIDIEAYASEYKTMLAFAFNSIGASALSASEDAEALSADLGEALETAREIHELVVSAYGAESDEALKSAALIAELEGAETRAANIATTATSLNGMAALMTMQMNSFDIGGIINEALGGEWQPKSFIAEGGIPVRSVQFIIILQGIND